MSEENNNENTNENNQTPENNGTIERFVEKNGERLAVPENFWDKEKNALDAYSLLKSQQDLRAQIGEDNSPKDGVYKINIPEEFKDRLEANPEDNLFKEFSKLAKSKRMTQEEFDAITAIYCKTMADNIQDFDSDSYFEAEANTLKEKFGDKLNRVKARIENFINNSGITDKDILNELKFMQTSANGVATLDYLLSLRGDPMPNADNPAVAGQMTLDELRALQAKPEYQSDPALQKKVEEGYKKLYGTY